MRLPRCCIYGLVDPRTGEVRYIGKTTYGIRRIYSHRWLLFRDKTYKGAWLRQLIAAGLWCEVRLLEELPAEELCAAEVRWIAYARKEGWPLTNLTDGGEGTHGLVRRPEHTAKIAAALRGRPLSLECRAKLSAVNRGKKLSVEHAAALRASHVGRPTSARQRARASEVHRGKVLSAETRAKIGKANSRAVVDEATGACYPSIREAAKVTGVSMRSIQRVLGGGRSRRVFHYA
jgi:NUMOD3 motif